MAPALRLADLLAGLSLFTDLGFGLPREHAMRSCVVATGLARRMGIPEEQVAETYYTALLEHVGCTAYSHETALAFRNELAMTAAGSRANFAEPLDVLTTFLPGVSRGRSLGSRVRLAAFALAGGGRFLTRYSRAACEVARRAAERLGLSAGVQRSLFEVFEWWNGKGAPGGLEGERIALPGRVSRVASIATLFDDMGGAKAARDAVRRRAGSLLDPGIVATFVAHAPELLSEGSSGDPREAILEVEPTPTIEKPEGELVEVASVFGDLADLKSPFLHGHSRGVAALACGAGEEVGLPQEERRRLEVAALLHDLGRVGISNEIWEKPGPLTTAEWEDVRLHAYHGERILSGSAALASLAPLAGMHHERLDGSGYHRGCSGGQLSVPARLLAAADAYQAMTQPRPHRPALTFPRAAAELAAEARGGRLAGDAVAAVLAAAGHTVPASRRELRPGGLSEREVEVLGLVSRGLSNKELAARLHISQRTAEHHVQHIYAKLGVRSRPALALFALERGLVGGTG